MAEENNSGEQTPEPKQFTEIEQRALDQGWRPKDEWDGDPEAWRPAKEFIDRGELFKKIEAQNRTIKQFQETLDQFAKHHSQVREVEYARAKKELLAAKKEALIEGDADAVIEIDEKLDAVKEAQRQADIKVPEVQAEPSVNPVFVAWRDRNSWYDSNEAMRAYADRIGNQLGAQGGYSAQDILSEVERRVKKEFASKFENPNRNKPGAVEGGTHKAGGKKDSFQLTDEERRVMRKFVGSVPGMTEEKYIADLKKIKGVE